LRLLSAMGCVNSTADVPVDIKPMSDPNELCVFGSEYVVQPGQNVVLRLKNKIFDLSGDTYKIINVKDESVKFQCKGKALSWTDKRVIFNAQDAPIFVMKEKLMQLDDKQSVYSTDAEGKPNDEMYKVGSNFGNTKQYTSGLKNKAGKEITVNGKMTILSNKGVLWYGEIDKGIPIAKLCSPAEFRDFVDAGTYFVEIAPGVDMALIVSMVLAYAEMESTYK